jgi:hypothetical protein
VLLYGFAYQAEGVGQKAMTAQAVGAEAVFEFLNAVLALAAMVVESEDFGGTSGAVSNHEAQVGAGGRGFGLVADAAQDPMGPFHRSRNLPQLGHLLDQMRAKKISHPSDQIFIDAR